MNTSTSPILAEKLPGQENEEKSTLNNNEKLFEHAVRQTIFTTELYCILADVACCDRLPPSTTILTGQAMASTQRASTQERHSGKWIYA
jgi:hypothetical protein